MKVTEHLKKAKETLFSYEILPPLKGASIQTIYDTLDELTEFKPPFIDVTYHREEYVYKTKQDGLLEKQSVRKRPGTVGICAAIMNKYNIDTVPHIICGGFNQEETENALIDLDFLGIDNLLVLRGDPINSETYFAAEKGGHKYASDLVKQVDGLNNGIYLDDDLRNSSKTNFCMGVAGYPEKHFEAPNMNSDIHFLKKKIECGSEYIVTQMFFDNNVFFQFVDLCRKIGIEIPIIPGIKILSLERHLETLPRHFYLNIPSELIKSVKGKSKSEVRIAGIDWATSQVQELIDYGAPCVHFYIMSSAKSATKVVSNFI